MMTINPNRTWLALMFAGVYQQTDAKISLLSPVNDEIIPQQVMTFPAISGGSHSGYYPPIQWMSDDTARVAIPHPDALYAVDEPLLTQLWQFQTDMTVTSLGELPNTSIAFTPIWSADGERLAYVDFQREQSRFLVIQTDSLQPIFESPFQFMPFFAIPQTSHFLFVNNGRDLMIADETETRLWLSAEGFILDIKVLDEGVVFVAIDDDSTALVYVKWDTNTVYEIVKISEYSFFDAK
jgi:hypothetical protein